MNDTYRPDDPERYRPPGERKDANGSVFMRSWRWGPDERRRPGLPWVGIFLVVFGGLLFVNELLPDYRRLGDTLILAAGIASLIAWILRRSTLALYAGAFLTALAMPGTLEGLGVPLGPGWGTVSFGLAFVFVAAVRAWRGGGWGWQLLYGGILILIGGSQIAKPDTAALVWPMLLVILGVILLIRGRD